MIIAGRPGHNELCRGAKALLDEVIEDRKIFSASKRYLEASHTFIDCTPVPIASQSQDLAAGVNKANNNSADFFYSVHLNKAYNSYEGAIGAEIWLYPKASQETIDRANRILKNLEALGFKNRGIKYSQGEHRLYEIYSTNMEAMIIECFFLEATKDVEIYNRVGADAIGFAIASGIDPRIVKEKEVTKKIESKYYVETSYIDPEKYANDILRFFDKENIKIQIKSDGKGAFLQTMHISLEKCRAIAYTFTSQVDIMAYVWNEDKITDQYGNISYSPRILV